MTGEQYQLLEPLGKQHKEHVAVQYIYSGGIHVNLVHVHHI